MRHIISLLLENEAGALSRVSGLFSARAFNIESLSVAPTEDPTVSRLTLVTTGSDAIVEQITKQLNKLVDVIKVVDLNEYEHVEKELLLTKLIAEKKEDHETVKRLVDTFNGRIVDVTKNLYTIEITDTCEKIDAFITTLDDRLILEVVRSGVSAISLGDKAIQS
ncbi:MAG: acetolactate synthase small subunit [Pseudomonadota bacterium]|nr:acetolactate synthase small subunit [Pseudomonadota bacterium]|tara:strand:+ start:1047 stop:1541 length:495 start_codon:yes stop_codon:yes gene_type:complete